MRIIQLSLALVALVLASCGTQKKSTQDLTKNTDQYIIQDSLSYAFGVVQAMEMKKQNMGSLNQADYSRAFKTTLKEESQSFPADLAYQIVEQSIQQKAKQSNQMNKEKGIEFLATNAQREEVKVTDSGLQYEIIKEGDGPIPTASQKVTTHYTGSLIDGTIFDSSVQRGEPITFPVGGVILGWQEALQLMPKGSKWKLYIPQELAYGERGAGAVIPPFSTLIFEIELLDIQ